MKKLIIAAAVLTACLARADEWVEIESPVSGDKVILNDRTYVILSVPDFEALTNKISILVGIAHKQWNNQHKTESGRIAWHGAKGLTTVKTNESGKLVKVVEYADGYKHVEESEIRRAPVRPLPSRREEIRREIHKNDIPRRLRDARKGVNVNKEVK